MAYVIKTKKGYVVDNLVIPDNLASSPDEARKIAEEMKKWKLKHPFESFDYFFKQKMRSQKPAPAPKTKTPAVTKEPVPKPAKPLQPIPPEPPQGISTPIIFYKGKYYISKSTAASLGINASARNMLNGKPLEIVTNQKFFELTQKANAKMEFAHLTPVAPTIFEKRPVPSPSEARKKFLTEFKKRSEEQARQKYQALKHKLINTGDTVLSVVPGFEFLRNIKTVENILKKAGVKKQTIEKVKRKLVEQANKLYPTPGKNTLTNIVKGAVAGIEANILEPTKFAISPTNYFFETIESAPAIIKTFKKHPEFFGGMLLGGILTERFGFGPLVKENTPRPVAPLEWEGINTAVAKDFESFGSVGLRLLNAEHPTTITGEFVARNVIDAGETKAGVVIGKAKLTEIEPKTLFGKKYYLVRETETPVKSIFKTDILNERTSVTKTAEPSISVSSKVLEKEEPADVVMENVKNPTQKTEVWKSRVLTKRSRADVHSQIFEKSESETSAFKQVQTKQQTLTQTTISATNEFIKSALEDFDELLGNKPKTATKPIITPAIAKTIIRQKLLQLKSKARVNTAQIGRLIAKQTKIPKVRQKRIVPTNVTQKTKTIELSTLDGVYNGFFASKQKSKQITKHKQKQKKAVDILEALGFLTPTKTKTQQITKQTQKTTTKQQPLINIFNADLFSPFGFEAQKIKHKKKQEDILKLLGFEQQHKRKRRLSVGGGLIKRKFVDPDELIRLFL